MSFSPFIFFLCEMSLWKPGRLSCFFRVQPFNENSYRTLFTMLSLLKAELCLAFALFLHLPSAQSSSSSSFFVSLSYSPLCACCGWLGYKSPVMPRWHLQAPYCSGWRLHRHIKMEQWSRWWRWMSKSLMSEPGPEEHSISRPLASHLLPAVGMWKGQTLLRRSQQPFNTCFWRQPWNLMF